jgi:hypothetical protein
MLIETQTKLAGVLAAIDLREQLAKRYQAQLDALRATTERPKSESREERSARLARAQAAERELERLEHSLFQLENGADWNAGICHPELELLAGKPGLRKLRIEKGRLEREVKELQAVEAQWAKGTRKFRYTGKPSRYRHDDGRYLEPGDEVELGRTRAMALRDFFEAVG